MPVTYGDGAYPCGTLTVSELIEIFAKQPLDAPVVLTFAGVTNGVSEQQIAVEDGCVVVDVQLGAWFSPVDWAESQLKAEIASVTTAA